jgi:predicted RecB family nuclease
MSDIPIITSEIFVAYSQCPRKAFLLLFSEDKGKPHDYPLILEERCQNNRVQYLEKFLQSYPEARKYDTKAFNKYKFLVEAILRSEQLEACCTVLTKADTSSEYHSSSYEPIIVTGTYNITPEQKTELLFVGWVLGQIQKQLPVSGQIVGMDGKAHRIQLESGYKSIKPLLKVLQNWCNNPPSEPPALILNKHCPSCQFQQICRQQAEKENNLSLLDRMTTKAIQKYNNRGIFTIQQLSYLFKPRRKRKKRKNPEPIKHSLELQALAIREQKIYIQEMPELTRQPVELFLDIEGIPDRRFYYLIGLLVYDGEKCVQHSFWADTPEDEETIWKQLLAKINEYPEAPIYHYGSYEIKAVSELAKRYTTDVEKVIKHLININSYIYGRIYFPIFSNRLKEIGSLIGASWTSPNPSGLQSLVWRYKWEENAYSVYKENLLTYNDGDCNALKLLIDKISEISIQIGLRSDIAFADQKQKLSTEVGEEIHAQLEFILKSSHADYNKNKIAFRRNKIDNYRHKVGGRTGHQGFARIAPSKINKVIELPAIKECKECGQELFQNVKKPVTTITIDLKFTKSGCKKIFYLYKSFNTYCKTCNKHFKPDIFYRGKGSYIFGHGFESWIVYQRVALRLSYNLIVNNCIEMFAEPISSATVNYILHHFADQYSDCETILLERILLNPFVHVDETSINIRGLNQYVWTFTDGRNVIFKLTQTREADIVHEILCGYNGVLISDFYGGYDSVNCKQQKCWVHLLRDINDDLWKSPFDTEYENFVLEIKKFILPIFEAIEKYGLKKRHLRKFKKEVDRFYKNNINDISYHYELAIKYQKRFERYQENLFTFLEYDFMPWHNS